MFASCQTNKESTIKIRSVDMGISTIMSVTCENFESFFDSSQVRTKKVDQTESVKSFLSQLSQLELDNDKRDPDTRAIIIIRNATNIDTICADRFSLKYQDKYYIMSNDLRRDIWAD
jgi:hypothetical protein